MDTDRSLRFAVLAVRSGLLSRDRLLGGLAAWAAEPTTPLPDLLVARGWISPADRDTVEAALDLAPAADSETLERPDSESGLPPVVGTLTDNRPDPPSTGTGPRASTLTMPPGDGPAFDAPPDPARYTAAQLHATGGVGRVWRAFDAVFGREVAVKDLRPDRAGNPNTWTRFLREARVTGRLQHPGVVPVYEIGAKPGTAEPFYTMRFVGGRTLAEAAREYHRRRAETKAGPLEQRDLLGAFLGVCNAVAYAHDRGVVHRDLKPQNVALGDFGEVMVLDWGLAKEMGNSERGMRNQDTEPDTDLSSIPHSVFPIPNSDETVAGAILGTPAYMAPEQARGEPADHRSDVYGLGAILFEILTGHAPYSGSTTDEVLWKVRETDPPRPRDLVASAPRPLEAICSKAMARDPADRYASAAELADDVRRFLADEPVSAYRDPVSAQVARWVRRHRPLVAGALAAVVVLAVSGTALGVRHARQEDERRFEEARLRREADSRLAVGLGVAHAGDVDRAIHSLSETVGFCRQSEVLAAQHDEAAEHLRQLERYKAFRAKAAAVLRQGVHNIRTREKPDPLLKQCEEALAVYEIATAPDWRGPTDRALSPQQAAEVRGQAHELLILAAIRLAMFDTRDKDSEANTRRGLDLLDRATKLETPGVGVWMLRMFWHRRLKEDEAANHAGDRMTQAQKEGRLTTARDYYLLASTTLQIMKDPKKAADIYRTALRLEPNHYGANFGLYLCYQQQGDARGELVPLTSCLVLRPDEPDLHYFRGYAYFRLGEYVAAYHDFDAAVGRDPRYSAGLYWRGRALVMANKWAEAEQDFTRALEVNPELRQALSWRAVARGKLGRHADAAADAELSVTKEPDHPDTLYYAARAYAVAVKAVSADAALAKKYADRAVELLGCAIEKGFSDADRFNSKGDFGPLYDRDDFQKLLKRLQELPPVKKPKEKKDDGDAPQKDGADPRSREGGESRTSGSCTPTRPLLACRGSTADIRR